MRRNAAIVLAIGLALAGGVAGGGEKADNLDGIWIPVSSVIEGKEAPLARCAGGGL